MLITQLSRARVSDLFSQREFSGPQALGGLLRRLLQNIMGVKFVIKKEM
jgi:hypothetical protein